MKWLVTVEETNVYEYEIEGATAQAALDLYQSGAVATPAPTGEASAMLVSVTPSEDET